MKHLFNRILQVIFISGIFSFAVAENALAEKPLALVYDGPGSCPISEGDCTGAAQKAVEAAGFRVNRVGPQALTSSSTEADYQKLFNSASVWVQPGGHSSVFLSTVTPELVAGIQRFVKSGKAYVGFCAGAFSATEFDGNLTIKGLDLIPGKTYPYPNDTIDEFFDGIVSHYNPDALYNQILEVTWNGKKRELYFEEGAYLDFSGVPPGQVEVTATLRTGQAISARASYGAGRVYITGSHPEAPSSWKSGLVDSDGSDFDLVKEMLEWVTHHEGRI
jgi:glutamine amidotransferase-like uncharacterized protein